MEENEIRVISKVLGSNMEEKILELPYSTPVYVRWLDCKQPYISQDSLLALPTGFPEEALVNSKGT